MDDRVRRIARALLPLLATLVFAAAMFFLYESLRAVHYRDVMARVRAYAPSTLALALAATAANYLVLTLYDVMALRYAGRTLPYGRTAFTSFLSYVFSYNVGLSIFGSSAVRLRLYSSWGIDAPAIARVVGFCAVTFWLGLATMGGLALVLYPPAFMAGWRLAGIAPLALVVAYLVASARRGEGIAIRGERIRLPAVGLAASQVLVASADWSLAALVLYALLPAGKPPFPSFLAIYVLAQLAGAASHVPGGVGVFESVLFASLSGSASADALAGALLAYRGIYYLMPLATAVVAFLAREAWTVRRGLAKAAAAASRTFAAMAPPVLAVVLLFSGAVLLFSGAVPPAAGRLETLDPFLPLPFLELSHFIASLVGLGLLVTADAARRRVDAAYWLALGLLAAGAALSLLKGLDYEEALLMAAAAALVAPARRFFTRRAALLARPSGPWVFAAGLAVVGTSFWLVAFAHRHALYAGEAWWAFELSKAAPRSLRAAVGVAVAAALLGARTLLSPSPRPPDETLETSEADARRILAGSIRASSNLVLLGDKRLRFGRGRNSFLMYGVSGRTFVVMGDPVGDPAEFPDLCWDFYEEVRRQGGRVLWYEVGAATLPLLSELGSRFYKIGEEALVDLKAFTLEGGPGKRLRPPRNKLTREGYTFRVVDAAEAAALAGELRAISDGWLATKKGREKGFSLGFFDEAYLANFRTALIEREGRTLAFSNLWESGDGAEFAIDLMRHTAEAPNGTMEFLFVELLLWGAARGCRTFNLGMAPLSGLEAREVAPIWNKAAATLYRMGEGLYNFRGLRAFKEKFNPTWVPRYLAVSGGSSLAVAAADAALLISRGRRSMAAAGRAATGDRTPG